MFRRYNPSPHYTGRSLRTKPRRGLRNWRVGTFRVGRWWRGRWRCGRTVSTWIVCHQEK